MDPSPRNISSFTNQDSPNQYSESSDHISPHTPQSQFIFASPNYLQNFNPFGPINQPPFSQSSPRFQGVQHQGSWLQPTPPSYQGFHLQESFGSPTMQFGAAANRPPSVLQFSSSVGAVANTSSHGSESSSPCRLLRCWLHHSTDPFTLEYIWREVKDLPKWRRIVQEESGNKRTKVSSSGAYTSSSSPLGSQPSQNMILLKTVGERYFKLQ